MNVSKIKFGRLIEFDPRSRNYPIRALIPSIVRPRSYTWRCNLQLDQGNTPACVGFSWSHEAAARPVEVKGITNAIALKLYKRAQDLDEYPGNDYEGSSVLGGAKAALEKGWYGSYRWAFGEEELCLAVGFHGPAVLGTNWYSGMMDPDSNGLIRIKGDVVGGHAYLVNGFNVKTGLYRIRNSWGREWGINGDCFIARDSMDYLLREQGECCIPVVRLKG